MLIRSWRRALGACAIVLFASMMLTACDDIDLHGDFDLGYDGQSLLIAVCHDAEITEVSVTEYVRGDDERNSRRIWEATGAASLAKGDTLIVGGQNPGLNTLMTEAPEPVAGIQYHVKFNDIPGQVPSALFVWPEGGVTKGKWLSTDGSIDSRPCAA